jgi:hypothetical protein
MDHKEDARDQAPPLEVFEDVPLMGLILLLYLLQHMRAIMADDCTC